MSGSALRFTEQTHLASSGTSSTNVPRPWAAKFLHVLHKSPAFTMAWHKAAGKHLGKVESVTFEQRVHTSPAGASPQENAIGGPLGTTVVWPVQTPSTSVTWSPERASASATDVVPGPGKTLACAHEVEKLNEAFDVLLAFFILACVLIIFLIYKVVQFKQKLKAPEGSGANRLEYYGFYQAARYDVTASLCGPFPTSLDSPTREQLRLQKQILPESEAQVILFEHSSL